MGSMLPTHGNREGCMRLMSYLPTGSRESCMRLMTYTHGGREGCMRLMTYTHREAGGLYAPHDLHTQEACMRLVVPLLPC